MIVIVSAVYAAARYLAVVPISDSPFTASVNTLALDSEVVWQVEEYATGLIIPWSMVFTSQERMLVTERPGSVRVIENGRLIDQPLHTFSEVTSTSEEGLMGLVLDPDYATNKYLYASLAYTKDTNLVVKIVKFKDQGNSISDVQVIFDDIPAARNHAGNRLRFGPDGKLYSTTGDATEKTLAQNLDSVAGKILRLNSDGSIPSDNPFPNSPIYSYGHRNAQGIDWQPGTGLLFETEHGPSLFDGPAGGDEVNIIEAGQNYGWPLVSHLKTQAGTQAPLLVYTPAEAPGSGTFYSSDVIPQFKNNFFFGALKGEGLVRLVFNPENHRQVQSQEKLFDGEYGRIRDVAQGLDGALYFSTSNRDGRGAAKTGDDKILRIIRK